MGVDKILLNREVAKLRRRKCKVIGMNCDIRFCLVAFERDCWIERVTKVLKAATK